MAKDEHLIRVEGVNHGAVLDDTNDISTRRGGSAMLRDAPATLPGLFSELSVEGLEASIGLFRVNTDEPDAVVGRIAGHLAQTYPHITFVVDAAPLGDDFGSALREVTARNRFRQLRQPTVTIPDTPAAADADPAVCQLDRLRPAVAQTRSGDKTLAVSASVQARRALGSQQREEFLQRLLQLDKKLPTTRDLATLAMDEADRFGNLGGKMAVLYADGNGFGGIKRALQNDRALARDFDRRVQSLQRAFLLDLVTSASADEHFRNAAALRLEVLLFGGDEVMLITPAWRGMETLQRFYEVVQGEKPPPELATEVLNYPLTYAAGLVFCTANTPIAEITRTAKGLAEAVKGVDRANNRFDYLVLESVDYPTQSVADFRRGHFGAGAANALAPLAPLTAASRIEGVKHLPWHERVRETAAFLDNCPRGAIRGLAQTWLDLRNADGAGPRKAAEAAFLERFERFSQLYPNQLEPLYARLFKHFVPDSDPIAAPAHAGWLHLTELWDYLAPAPAEHSGRAAP